jgi:hypothetical protein
MLDNGIARPRPGSYAIPRPVGIVRVVSCAKRLKRDVTRRHAGAARRGEYQAPLRSALVLRPLRSAQHGDLVGVTTGLWSSRSAVFAADGAGCVRLRPVQPVHCVNGRHRGQRFISGAALYWSPGPGTAGISRADASRVKNGTS